MRRSAFLGLALFLVPASCTITTTPNTNLISLANFDAGTGAVGPQVVLSSALSAGGSGSACNAPSGSWMSIGQSSSPVPDGTPYNGAVAGVRCSVVAQAGGSFLVNATASLAGQGAFSVSGVFTPNASTTVTVSFQRSDLGSFDEPDCTVTYPDAEGGVASGRVWATVTCPEATYAAEHRICNGVADFTFENCSQ